MEMEMSGRKCDIPVLRTYGLGMNVVSTMFRGSAATNVTMLRTFSNKPLKESW